MYYVMVSLPSVILDMQNHVFLEKTVACKSASVGEKLHTSIKTTFEWRKVNPQ